jgi:hypothetical protein
MRTRKNLGLPDRVGRIVVGVVLLTATAFAFCGPETPLAYLGLVGIVPLIAGIIGHCTVYRLLRINTCRRQELGNQGS